MFGLHVTKESVIKLTKENDNKPGLGSNIARLPKIELQV